MIPRLSHLLLALISFLTIIPQNSSGRNANPHQRLKIQENSVRQNEPIPKDGDRIGWSSDGNLADEDDWAATAMALAIFAKMGWQDKLTHFDYNNRLDRSLKWKETENFESTISGADRFGFNREVFFDDQRELEASIEHAKEEINKSHEGSKFWYVQAGPFEVAYQALLRAKPEKRKYCILVSHSEVNEKADKWKLEDSYPSHGKDDCVALGAQYFFTTNQYREKFGGKVYKRWDLVEWLKRSPSEEYQWVYSRFLETAKHKENGLDASDGGMAFALATGDLNGNFSPKLRDFLGTSWRESVNQKLQINYAANIPQLAFAANELRNALMEKPKDLKITLRIEADTSKAEAFKISRNQMGDVIITGTDAKGAMYGGIEVAERLKLDLPIIEDEQMPYIEKRGIKYNIPWDVRTRSYDDSGDAAQNNIETVWDFGFWKQYLDDLARYRYNVLSLWSAHPYPCLVKLDEYPEVAMEDVYRIGVDLKPNFKKSGNEWPVDLNDPGVMKLVKKMTIEEKIQHWKEVFKYAEDRGIDIYLFHWNVFTYGATDKYGITQDQTNPITVDYLRKSVEKALLTYPQIKGIGVTAGENADNHITGEYSIENFLFNTYGRAMMNVMEEQPERDFRFIFRKHQSGLGPITKAFEEFDGEFNTSFKYVIGHMYVKNRPQIFDRWFREEVEEYNASCFMNLRNDDMFVLRWGNPDFVSNYIKEMPHDVSPGFYMGSDGYVWGREFVSKNPATARLLEINKHWYRMRQWGQLAYNPSIDRDYWEATLNHRFSGSNGKLLYDAWSATSNIIPLVNSSNWWPNDAQIAPEGCIDFTGGFLTIDKYYFRNTWASQLGTGYQTVMDWGKSEVSGKKTVGISPLVVADELDAYAATALDALPKLRQEKIDNPELLETLNDIEGMAYLGRYYADKMRGAAKLAAFREDSQQKKYNLEAVSHLNQAVDEWKSYSAIMTSQYKPQLLARTDYLDWSLILKGVEKEAVDVANEGDYPEVHFSKLKDGMNFSAGTNLKVEVQANDKHGIKETRLYLNGLLLKPNKKNPNTWSSKSEELLKGIKTGKFQLKAVAEDNTETFGWAEIEITVGNVSDREELDFDTVIFQKVLKEGEKLTQADVRIFPRLECYLILQDDGRLTLHQGTPDDSKGEIWHTSMHKDRSGDPLYSTLENGRLTTWRVRPDQTKLKLYQGQQVSGSGPFKLGITVSKKLVVFRETEGEEREIVWKSN